VALAIALKIPAPKIAQRLNSLSARLILAATIWTVVGLVVGGITLSGIFRASVAENFDSTLETDLDGLIAATDADQNGDIALEPGFVMARYQRVYSGRYWQIVPVTSSLRQTHAKRSRSLFDKVVVPSDRERRADVAWGHAPGPDGQDLRTVERRIEFPVTATAKPDNTRAYTFLVAGDTAEVQKRVSQFNNALLSSFSIVGLGLLAAIFLQVRVGLQPLRRVSEALARIRAGKARQLEGDFPAEIAPLAAELNSLIAHSAEVVGRARAHVSNLAHFLKTPLTVISSEAAAHPGPLADAVMRQVGTMRRQVDHYLARARAAGAVDVLGNRTGISSVLTDLGRVLNRIHSERGVTIELDCPASLFFRGERQDLEEMAGNLIDNACKWAAARVRVQVWTRGNLVEINVEDDGDGLSAEERQLVGERGERLDETVPGSGLGLAIVRDIAKLYGGSIELGDSAELGGLKAVLSLPVAA
jgi:signal transduction histidine kinase